MVTEFLRRCYRRKCRYWIDDLVREDEIIYQWAAPDAKCLPIPHRFGSGVFDREHGIDNGGIGEIRGSEITYISGDLYNKLPGKCFIGSADQWLHGIKTTDPAIPTPDCCRATNYQFRASGGLGFGGDATTSVKPHLLASGGSQLSGSADVVVHRNIVSAGVLRSSGTASTALTLLQADNGQAVFGGSATVVFSPAEFVLEDPDTSLPASIPDNDPSGVVLTFTVSGVDPTYRLTALHLNITHDDPSQLTFYLTGPNGLTFNIGSYAPTILISLFADAPNGVWQLRIVDQVPFGIGQVNAAQLQFGIARAFQMQAAMLASFTGSASVTFTPASGGGGGDIDTTCCTGLPNVINVHLTPIDRDISMLWDDASAWVGFDSTDGGDLVWQVFCDATTWVVWAYDANTFADVYQGFWYSGNYSCSPMNLDADDVSEIDNNLYLYYGESVQVAVAA